MNYLFKTAHGEYEITDEDLKRIFNIMQHRGNQHWIELPNGVFTDNSNWDIVPIKEKGAPATEPWGKTKKGQCCDFPAIQVRYRADKNGKKRYMNQCIKCHWKGVQMKVSEVIALGYDPETVGPAITVS